MSPASRLIFLGNLAQDEHIQVKAAADLFLDTPQYNAQGTAADAKAMLDKTITALKADKAKTLEQINAASNGFLVGDIYPFCFQLSDPIFGGAQLTISVNLEVTTGSPVAASDQSVSVT